VVGGGVPSTISNNFGKGRGMTSCFRPRPNSILSVCALAAAVFVVVLIFDEDIPNLLLLPMTAAMVMLFDENLENVALSSALS